MSSTDHADQGEATSTGPEAILLSLGGKVVQHVAPKGIERLDTWFRGKHLLVVGQARAGKTTFINYLRDGILEEEQDIGRTIEKHKQGTIKLKMGRDKALELRIRSTIDLPGQVGPVEHAFVAFYERPHAIVVFTDLTTNLNGEPDRAAGAWLSTFCSHLDDLWRSRGRSLKNPLEAMVVVTNKSDKVTPSKIDSRKRGFRRIVDQHLNHSRGHILGEIPIMPCTVVTNPKGEREVDMIITYLARQFAT